MDTYETLVAINWYAPYLPYPETLEITFRFDDGTETSCHLWKFGWSHIGNRVAFLQLGRVSHNQNEDGRNQLPNYPLESQL